MQFQSPLAWPAGWQRTPSAQRKDDQFRTGQSGAVERIAGELAKLKATDVVVTVAAALRKSDGRPYHEAMTERAIDPGVAVYFKLKGKDVVMARDGHPTILANLMSIAHTLEHMRGLERHGGSAMLERAFTGFLALPAPDHWTRVLGVAAEASIDDIQAAFRFKAMAAHPDKPGGSHHDMARLTKARDEALKGRTIG